MTRTENSCGEERKFRNAIKNMFTFIPLCLSTLFIPIKYSENKWNWQEEAKNVYINGEDNCIYSYVVKTGHGKTKFYCECAINSEKPFSYIFIKWDETVDNFIKHIKELAPNSTINKGHKQIIFKINENKTEEESIAEQFGALGKDNSIDTNRVHLIFLNDLRSGKLGGITLDEV